MDVSKPPPKKKGDADALSLELGGVADILKHAPSPLVSPYGTKLDRSRSNQIVGRGPKISWTMESYPFVMGRD